MNGQNRQFRVAGGCALASAVFTSLFLCAGCAKDRSRLTQLQGVSQVTPSVSVAAEMTPSGVIPASHEEPARAAAKPKEPPSEPLPRPETEPGPFEMLEDLEAAALTSNPTIRRLELEASAKWSRTGYVSKLPDPTLGAMFFGDAMMLEPDRQLAEVQVMQMIPWLGRLDAEAKEAYFEAAAAQTMAQGERLRTVAEVRTNWFKLYLLQKQLEFIAANREQLAPLIEVTNARIAGGTAQPGDVLMATLELSELERERLEAEQELVAATAELNRLVGRDARTPIKPPAKIDSELPDWSHDLLRELAFENQPEIVAARLETAATRWGVEVARLKRRPDIGVGATWMVMDADNADPTPGAGNDSWALGVNMTLPLGHRKYDAIQSEANWRHFAAHSAEDEAVQRVDAMLRDLWQQAAAAQQMVELYEKTILPQAQQTLDADLQSLATSTVTFDRVIRDYRAVLTVQLALHRAMAQRAIALARIRQIVGVDVVDSPRPEPIDSPAVRD